MARLVGSCSPSPPSLHLCAHFVLCMHRLSLCTVSYLHFSSVARVTVHVHVLGCHFLSARQHTMAGLVTVLQNCLFSCYAIVHWFGLICKFINCLISGTVPYVVGSALHDGYSHSVSCRSQHCIYLLLCLSPRVH